MGASRAGGWARHWTFSGSHGGICGYDGPGPGRGPRRGAWNGRGEAGWEGESEAWPGGRGGPGRREGCHDLGGGTLNLWDWPEGRALPH